MSDQPKPTGASELAKALAALSAAVGSSREELQRASERLDKVERHLAQFSETIAKTRRQDTPANFGVP